MEISEAEFDVIRKALEKHNCGCSECNAAKVSTIFIETRRPTKRATDVAKAVRSIRWDEDGISAAGHGGGE